MMDVGIGSDIKKEIPAFIVDVASHDLDSVFAERIALIEKNYNYYSNAAREYVLRRHSFQRFKEEWLGLLKERTAC